MRCSVPPLLLLCAAASAQQAYSRYTFDEAFYAPNSSTVADSGERGAIGDGVLYGYENSPSFTVIGGRSVLAFNGSSTYVQALVPLNTGTTAYTIEAKMMFLSYTELGTIVKNWWGGFHFGLDQTSPYISNFIATDPLSYVVSPVVTPLNQWITVTVSFDGSNSGSQQQRLFLNGNLVATAPVTGAFSQSTGWMTIGVKGAESGEGVSGEPGWLHGYMDELAFYTSQIPPTAPIPEPSTYGLILGGLALAGAAIRRRRAK